MIANVENEMSALIERIQANKSKFPKHLNTVDELCIRLKQLVQTYTAAMDTNREIKLKNPLRLKMELHVGGHDSGFDEIVFSVGGRPVTAVRIKRKDPNAPITLHDDDTADGDSLLPTKGDPMVEELGIKLAAQLEAFYTNAYKIWNLCSDMNKSKLGEIGVVKVRNDLIAHPDKDAIHSIGASQSHGPCVKPSKKTNTSPKKNYHDAGLVANTREFLDGLNAWLDTIEVA